MYSENLYIYNPHIQLPNGSLTQLIINNII